MVYLAWTPSFTLLLVPFCKYVNMLDSTPAQVFSGSTLPTTACLAG